MLNHLFTLCSSSIDIGAYRCIREAGESVATAGKVSWTVNDSPAAGESGRAAGVHARLVRRDREQEAALGKA